MEKKLTSVNLCTLLVVLESTGVFLVDLQFLSTGRLRETILAARVVVVKESSLCHVGCLLAASARARLESKVADHLRDALPTNVL